MTETLVGVSPPPSKDPADPPSAEELAAAKELVRQARAQGVALTGPGGLLKALTKTVIETALEEEMAEHLGYDKHDPLGRNRGNSRNGKRAKTVLTDSGEVAVEVPRDRDGSFEPVIVAKRQRRLSSIDEIVLSLYARGLTTGDIAAYFAEIYDAQVSKDTISRITDRVVEEMQAWTSRRWSRFMPRWCWTRSTSRSATAKSLTGPSMPRSGSTWRAIRTSWACGSATAAGSRQSFGWRR
jgi:putative transposase